MEIFIFFQHIVIVEDLNREIATLEEVSNNISLIYTDTLEKEMYSRGIYRLRTCFEIKYDIHKGFKGILIEDIIYETLKLFIEGKRKWYKDKFPEFKDQLLSSFDSVISNTINKMNHIESVSLDDNSFSIPDEEKNNYSDYISFCEKELENLNATDEEILLFEPYIIEGIKRSELSKEYGISESELTNINKRLKRKLPIIREKLMDYLK